MFDGTFFQGSIGLLICSGILLVIMFIIQITHACRYKSTNLSSGGLFENMGKCLSKFTLVSSICMFVATTINLQTNSLQSSNQIYRLISLICGYSFLFFALLWVLILRIRNLTEKLHKPEYKKKIRKTHTNQHFLVFQFIVLIIHWLIMMPLFSEIYEDYLKMLYAIKLIFAQLSIVVVRTVFTGHEYDQCSKKDCRGKVMSCIEIITIRRKNMFVWIITILLLFEILFEATKIVLGYDEFQEWAWITMSSYYFLLIAVILIRYLPSISRCCKSKDSVQVYAY